jgi:thioredoxin 1
VTRRGQADVVADPPRSTIVRKELRNMAGQNTKEFKDDTFETDVLNAKEPVLVDFWAEWCMPCKALGPTIDELADEYAGKVKIGKMNTESNNDTPIKYGVTAIPTILLFNHGQVIQKFVGLKNKTEFKEAIDKVAG